MIQCVATVLVFDFGLQATDGGWSAAGSLGQWEYGNATVAGYSGPMWGTRLGGPYLNDTSESVIVPLPTHGGLERPVLVLEHHHDLGLGDRAFIELDAGAGWVPVEPIGGYPPGGGFVGSNGGFEVLGVDLSPYPSATAVRLRLEADTAGSGPGWFVRRATVVDGDPIPPEVTITSGPPDAQDLEGPYAVEFVVLEDVGVQEATVLWQGGGASGEVPAVASGGGYRAALPPVPPGTDVTWAVRVSDCASTVTVDGDPFRIFLAAPTGLSGPQEPHVVARNVTLTWVPPVSPYPVLGYQVRELSTDALVVATGTSAEVPVDPAFQEFVVEAVYDAGTGDPSDVLVLDVEVPELVALRPDAAFPGERRYLEIEGHSLYLLQGLSTVGLGQGVSVESLVVRDVNRAVAVVAVDADASAGPRTLWVTGAQGAFSFEEAFTVGDAADAPRVVSITPSSIVQGGSATLEIVANRPFAGPVVVTTDEEMVATGEATVEGDTARVALAVQGRARPGDHVVILDDGVRLWTVPVEVEEYRAELSRCASSGGGPSVWWAVALGLSAVRRRSASPRGGRTTAGPSRRGTPPTRTPPPRAS